MFAPSRLARVGDSGFPIPARNGARARHRRRGNVGGKGGAAQAAAEATGGREGGDGWLVGGEARRLCWLLSCLNPDRNSNGRADGCWLQNPTAQEARNARIEIEIESPLHCSEPNATRRPLPACRIADHLPHCFVLALANCYLESEARRHPPSRHPSGHRGLPHPGVGFVRWSE